jgi:hypothetical protein
MVAVEVGCGGEGGGSHGEERCAACVIGGCLGEVVDSYGDGALSATVVQEYVEENNHHVYIND